MSTGSDLISLIASRQNLDDYQKKHWSGSFAEYLDIVRRDPRVTRTAYQRLYDMITSKGTEEIIVNKEKLLRYKFFEDPDNAGEDAIYGLERTMTSLVNVLKMPRTVTAPSGVSCCCMGRSAVPRARSRADQERSGAAIPVARKAGFSVSAGKSSDPTARKQSPIARCTKSPCT